MTTFRDGRDASGAVGLAADRERSRPGAVRPGDVPAARGRDRDRGRAHDAMWWVVFHQGTLDYDQAVGGGPPTRSTRGPARGPARRERR